MIDQNKNSKDEKKSSYFINDVMKLLTGTIFIQLISFAASPLLTRLYGPEAFGIWAIFTAVTGIIGVVACMRYESSIVLPEKNADAANLVGLCLFIISIMSIAIIPLLIIFRMPLISFLNSPELNTYLWLIPPFVFIGGVFLVFQYWCFRKKRYQQYTGVRIINSLTTTSFQIGGGISGYGSGGSLIQASIIGQFVATSILVFQVLKEDFKIFYKNITFKGIIKEGIRYKKFPIFDTFSELLNSLSWQLPIFLLAAFFSPMITGFFALGLRVVQLPMTLIGSSISQAFFKHAVEARALGNLNVVVENIFRLLVFIGLFPLLLLTLIGADFFSLFFGEIWIEAGIYCQILAFWGFIWFISSPLSILYYVLERQESYLLFACVNFITRLIALIFGGLLGDARLTILLFSLSGCITYGYLLNTMMKYSSVNRSIIVRIFYSNIVKLIPLAIVILSLKFLGFESWIILLSSMILGLTYYIYIIKTDCEIKCLLNEIPLFTKILKVF